MRKALRGALMAGGLCVVGAAVLGQAPARDPRRSTDPKPIPDQPGRETLVKRPVSALALSSIPVTVQIVRTASGWPVVNVPVGASGGYAPLTLSVEAGAQTALFEIATPGVPRISEAGPREISAGVARSVSPTGDPAVPITRALRFKGSPGSTQLPTAIPVIVRLRDGKGSTTTKTTTFYPIAPSIETVTGHEGKTTRQAIPSLRIHLVGLGAANDLKVHAISGCGYQQRPGISYADNGLSLPGQATGKYAISRTASLGSSSCSNLKVRFALAFPGSPAFREEMTLTSPTFQLSPRETYTFTNTWDLQGKLGFAVHEASGTCQGKSEMPTQPSYPVGVMKDGGDITFKIRSGPVGTSCVYASKAWVLPDGFEITKFDLSSSRSGPEEPAPEGSYARCCTRLGDGKMCSGMTISNPLDFGFSFLRGLKPMRKGDPPASFQVSGWERPLLTPDNVILYSNLDNRYTTVIPPLTARPTCLSTLLNDKFVTIRIDEIRFSGPPGVSFP